MLLRRKKSIKNITIIFILVSFIFLIFISSNVIFYSYISPEYYINDLDQKDVLIKSSEFWNLSNITIDDSNPINNWTWASKQPWCSGNGTQEDPYIIENVTIDGSGLPSGNSCIYIKNSTAYFKIINCTLINAPEFGILLDFASNGQLLNNNISYNKFGIGMLQGYNYTVNNNTLRDNVEYGLWFGRASGAESTITNNVIQGSHHGIYLTRAENYMFYNNSVNYNDFGITLTHYYLFNSINNIFTQNRIINNSQVGINATRYASGNSFYNNTFSGNSINAIDETGSNNWNSSQIGNYWDDYDGFDLNEDGRGETPYKLYNSTGFLINYDYLPIWNIPDDVDPIISPKISNNFFGKAAPVIEITIDEYELNESWFIIDGGDTKYYFDGTSVTIDQELWNALPDGTHTLKIFALDSSGNTGTFTLNIVKNSFLEDMPFFIIIIVIIISLIGFGSISVYQFIFKPNLSERKKVKDIIKQWNSEKNIPDKLRTARTSNETDNLKHDEFTLISKELLTKVDLLNISMEEKEDILKDILSMTPEMRNEFLDDFIKNN